MKRGVRFVVEGLLLFIMSAALLVGAIFVARQIFDDEKTQYFVIGYYAAIHTDLARWIWKRLPIEKQESPA